MKNACETSAMRKRAIKRLAQMSKGLKQTHERVFLDDAICALKEGDDSCAVESIRICFESLNLTQGEVRELKKMVGYFSPSILGKIQCSFPWSSSVWAWFPIETKSLILGKVLMIIYEKCLSIYFYINEHKHYNTTICRNPKFISG